MGKNLSIVKIIENLKERAEKAKIERAKLETSRDVFATQAKESADEIIRLTNSKDLKEAFTKLMNATKLEVELETVFNNIAQCYEDGDFEDLEDLAKKAKDLSGKIEIILGNKNNDSSVGVEDNNSDKKEAENLKDSDDEDVDKEESDEEEEDTPVKKQKSKKVVPENNIKKQDIDEDDEDEDI